MANVFEIADYLIYLAQTSGEPERLSTKKLQKLLYYAQGIAVSKLGRPLFPDKIKAWVQGPVVPVVWHQYKEHTDSGVSCRNVSSELSIEDRVFLRQIWKLYGQYTGDFLSQRTHEESPWLDARSGLQPSAKSDTEVSVDALKKFFASKPIELPEVPRPVEIRRGREVYRIEDAGKLLPTRQAKLSFSSEPVSA